MDVTRWLTPKSDWLYSLQPKMEKVYTVSKNKTRSWLWLRSWTPYARFRLKLKEVEKTTRPFRYDLNQILYAGTRSDRKSAWWTMDGGLWHCTGDRNQDHPSYTYKNYYSPKDKLNVVKHTDIASTSKTQKTCAHTSVKIDYFHNPRNIFLATLQTIPSYSPLPSPWVNQCFIFLYR